VIDGEVTPDAGEDVTGAVGAGVTGGGGAAA